MANLLLIDNRIHDVNIIINSLLPNIHHIIIDNKTNIIDCLLNKQLQNIKYNRIGIIQENSLQNIETIDSNIELELHKWSKYKQLLDYCKLQLQVTQFDLISCNISSNRNWKYVIDTFMKDLDITIYSSNHNIGSEYLGGNWILESNNVELNLIGQYFTEKIKTYSFILGTANYYPKYVRSRSGVKLGNISAISAKNNSSFFLDTTGNIFVSGINRIGQFGNGTISTAYNSVPTIIYLSPTEIVTGIINISVGYSHTLLLTINGNVLACGNNQYGQLGNGENVSSNYPKYVCCSPGVRLTNIVAISAGFAHSLFLTSEGTVLACGYNNYGQLCNGDPSTISVFYPRNVYLSSNTILSGIIEISAGFYHSVFLKSDGGVLTGGYNYYGQLGNGNTNAGNYYPNNVFLSSNTLLTGIKSISTGNYYSVFLNMTGTAYACGFNLNGELGNGTNINQSYPTYVYSGLDTILRDIVEISTGISQSLFLLSSGNVVACGNNNLGQLGIGPYPTNITSISLLQLILAGYNLNDLKNMKIAKNDYTSNGISLTYLKNIGFSGRNAKLSGYTIPELNSAGYNLYEIINSGYTFTELNENGITASQIKNYYVNPTNYVSILPDSFTFSSQFNATTVLFANSDDTVEKITMPINSNFIFSYIHVSSNGWIQLSNSSFGPVDNFGMDSQDPINTIRIYSRDLQSSVKYTIQSDYIYLLYTGYNESTINRNPITIKVIINSNGIIYANYSLSSLITSSTVIIGLTGSNSRLTVDDLYLPHLFDVNLYNILNNKTIQFYLGVGIVDLKMAGFTITNLLDAGYDILDVKNIGYNQNDFIIANYTIDYLKFVGYSVFDLKLIGYTNISDLLHIGYSYYDIRIAEYTIMDFKLAGYTITNFKLAGYTKIELFDAGYSIFDLKMAGYTIDDFNNAGFSMIDLDSNGYTLTDFVLAGYALFEIINTGFYSFTELKENGITAAQIKKYYVNPEKYVSILSESIAFSSLFTATTLLFANSDDIIKKITIPPNSNFLFSYIYVSSNGWIQFSDSTIPPNNDFGTNIIRFYSRDIQSSVKYTIQTDNIYLLYTGYNEYNNTIHPITIKIIINSNGVIYAKYTVNNSITNSTVIIGLDNHYLPNLINANLYTILNNKIIQFYKEITINELLIIGYTLEDLKDAGYTKDNFIEAGYGILDLKNAEYKKDDFIAAGYSIFELKAVGYTKDDFEIAGYIASDFKNAGYSIDDFEVAGYTVSDLKEAGFNKDDFTRAGYSILNLKEAGYKKNDFTRAGYDAYDLETSNLSVDDMYAIGYTSTNSDNGIEFDYALTHSEFTNIDVTDDIKSIKQLLQCNKPKIIRFVSTSASFISISK